MKKLLLVLLGTTVFSLNSLAQWKVKTVDNGFDKPYKIAYTEDGQSEYLKLENYKGIAFYMGGVYVCDETVGVDVSFLINDTYKKYFTSATVSDNRTIVFIVDDLNTDPDFLADFKAASAVRIRINDTTCGIEIYDFKMTGSTAAFNAIVNQ